MPIIKRMMEGEDIHPTVTTKEEYHLRSKNGMTITVLGDLSLVPKWFERAQRVKDIRLIRVSVIEEEIQINF